VVAGVSQHKRSDKDARVEGAMMYAISRIKTADATNEKQNVVTPVDVVKKTAVENVPKTKRMTMNASYATKMTANA
jgi:hypothetical protein